MPVVLVVGTLLRRTRWFFPIASTRCTYPRRDGQAEWLRQKPPNVATNPSANRSRRSLTLLQRPTPLRLRQTSERLVTAWL